MKKSAFLILVVGASVAQAAPVLYNGHYYDFVDGYLTADAAEAAAAASTFMGANGYLATVTDAGENAFLQATFGAAGKDGWIGLKQDANDGEPNDGWEWITGETYSYSNWAGGEPNDAGGEDNVHMYSNGQWNDLAYNNTFTVNGYYVEYEPVPEPATMAALGLGLAAVARRRRAK